jgi:polyisoprenoid-binding protein YceI
VTKPVTLDVTVNKIGTNPMRGVPAAGFDATATIKRSDFGVALYVPNVSDEVTLHITMETFAPKPQTPKPQK